MHIIPDLGPSLALTLPFFVSFFGLWLILWKPLMEFLDAREAATVGARHEAETLAHAAESKAAELEQRLAEARREVIEIHAAARARSQVKEAEVLAAARATADAQVASAQRRIGEEREQAKGELATHARALSQDIVDTLLA